jgi:polyisoprenoid-binding protein YceI
MTQETTTTETPKATKWQVDTAHTTVEFAVRHLMISTVKGRFTGVQGTVTMPDEDPARARVEVTIDAASISTGNEQRDQHLRSPDFLDVARFPTLTFRSTKVEPLGSDQFRLTGDLTIKGVTRPVELVVTREGAVKDPWGGYRAGFTATGKLRRSDFGITWNQMIEAGGVAVGDEVKLAIEVELVREALPAAA